MTIESNLNPIGFKMLNCNYNKICLLENRYSFANIKLIFYSKNNYEIIVMYDDDTPLYTYFKHTKH